MSENFKKLPAFLPLGEDSEFLPLIDALSQQEFQKHVDSFLARENTNWALSGYLENRATLLKDCSQMVSEGRFYHLGVDITAPLGTPLFAPLNCEVVRAEYESGEGNYGGFVVLKCCENNTIFYILFGHLNPNTLPPVGTRLSAGERFAELGDYHENGNWFYHTHLQVLTEKGYRQGWVNKGYCAGSDLTTLDQFCPNPISLLKL
jgi:hypothetical protein